MYNVTTQLAPNGFTVAELFAGGGLMAVGLRAAGYNLIWANDFDKSACAAYRHNLGDHIVHGDITALDIDSIPDADVIAGGPPCQDYSVAGTGVGEEGERGKLVWRYLEIIERKRPKAFVFENVKGLITKRHRPTFDALLERFAAIGYMVSWRLINTWDYGVAQKRERVFIVGIRKDLGFAFEFPEPSPEDYRTQVLRDAIGDLPEPGMFENHVGTKYVGQLRDRFCSRPTDWNKPSPTIANTADGGGPMPHPHPNWQSNEQIRNHGPVADMNEPGTTATTQFRCQTVEITNHQLKLITPGIAGHNERHKNKGNGFGLAVQDMEKPCGTIDGHTGRGSTANIPPSNPPRRFTVRECLRIQSVPDWYVIPDVIEVKYKRGVRRKPFPLSAQYRIVGNGVASRVAYLLGIALAKQLSAAVVRNDS